MLRELYGVSVAYSRRCVDDLLDDLQADLPAVVLAGPRAVGKTATAQRRAVTILNLERTEDRGLLHVNRDRLNDLPGPILIDEWQQEPAAWDYVRRSVDAGAPAGHFLLAGSAAPQRAPMHSGAGRIVSIRMRPLSFAERGLQPPTVSLARLLERDDDVPAVGPGSVGIEVYVHEILASGLPGIRPLGPKNRARALAGYVQAIVHREFPEQGHPVRKPESLLGWLRAYAAATGTTASYSTILAAATPGVADKPARSTTEAYRDVLAQLWLLDPLPAWTPRAGHFTRLGSSPKHYLADPALAATLLGLRHDDLLLPGREPRGAGRSQPVLGALFEHLVALSVLTYADLAQARVAHFRRQDDEREVDLIVERGACVVAIEVKVSPEVSDSDVRHLLWLRERLGDRCAAAMVVTTGRVAYRRPDGVLVVPLAHLGP
jgi:uncharacterized protein